MQRSKGFNKGHNQGTAVCVECGKRTWKEYADNQCGMCEKCYTAAGVENEHLDGLHTAYVVGCPKCDADKAAAKVRLADIKAQQDAPKAHTWERRMDERGWRLIEIKSAVDGHRLYVVEFGKGDYTDGFDTKSEAVAYIRQELKKAAAE